MDNAYFIGYRIDVNSDEVDSWDLTDGLEDQFDVDDLPGKEWMVFPNAGGGNSFLWMKGKGADYRCPIDRTELWKDLHHSPFDFPHDGMETFQRLWDSDLYKYLIKKYGEKAVEVKWGIFLCLG